MRDWRNTLMALTLIAVLVGGFSLSPTNSFYGERMLNPVAGDNPSGGGGSG